MFALFSAIQRRAWVRARKLCYELILCDPLRKTYRDLHDRIDQIIRVINQRTRFRVAAATGAAVAAWSSGRKPLRTRQAGEGTPGC